MRTIISHKDVCKLESFVMTDVASLSLWNSPVEGNHIEVDTGSDGNFKVIIYFNQDISSEDKALIYKSEKAIKLTTAGSVYVGSTEWMNENITDALQKNLVDSIELPFGNYIVDAHSLLVKDPTGKPKYMQFAFCIFPEAKYSGSDTQPHTVTNPLPLKYQG